MTVQIILSVICFLGDLDALSCWRLRRNMKIVFPHCWYGEISLIANDFVISEIPQSQLANNETVVAKAEPFRYQRNFGEIGTPSFIIV